MTKIVLFQSTVLISTGSSKLCHLINIYRTKSTTTWHFVRAVNDYFSTCLCSQRLCRHGCQRSQQIQNVDMQFLKINFLSLLSLVFFFFLQSKIIYRGSTYSTTALNSWTYVFCKHIRENKTFREIVFACSCSYGPVNCLKISWMNTKFLKVHISMYY